MIPTKLFKNSDLNKNNMNVNANYYIQRKKTANFHFMESHLRKDNYKKKALKSNFRNLK
jgi:hypothetical protein